MAVYRDPTRSPRERAEDLLARLTLREKVGQLNQRLYGFACYERAGEEVRLSPAFTHEVDRWGGLGVLYGLYRADPWSGRTFETGLEGALARKAYNLAQRYVLEHSRLGIPLLLSSECPHGHQALDGYLLPVNLAMGAAWDPELVRRAAAVCGEQLKDLGVDLALVSMLDVLRDPRWGRSEECFSEDPVLAAALAKAAAEGYQSAGVDVVAKHFCAQGETTGGVNASAARLGPRELREIHLPPMRAAARAGAKGVMAAYNEIDGVYCHASRELLTDVLRGELGFQGLVMADGTALDRLDALTGDPAASGALGLAAGVDVSLWDEAFSRLEEAVARGLVPESEVDRACLRVLELKFARGLFEHPTLDETPPQVFSYAQHPESLELARRSPVLLKNQGILPLKPCKVAVLGPNGDSLYNQLGDYTPPQRPGSGVTLVQGLRGLLGEENVTFAQGCPVCGEDEGGFPAALAAAKEADVVILALGGSSSRFAGATFDVNGAAILDGPVQMDCGEGVDSPTLGLPGSQEALAEAVFALGKPVVTVVIAGRPYAIPELAQRSEALLYAFYPGPLGGQALAEILTGAVAPSGRLPASLPRSVGHLPCYYDQKASAAGPETPWLYPFGFGLGYTRFAAEDVRFPEAFSLAQLQAGRWAEVRFTLRNVGDRPGAAVPQLYLHDVQASTARRVKELKAFARVELAPGEAREVTLALGTEELSLWDRDMRFVPEAGDFRLMLEEGGALLAEGVFTLTD